MTKHSRFLHIEQRRADDAPRSESADRARIAAVLDTTPPHETDGVERLEVVLDAPAGAVKALDPARKTAEMEEVPELAIDVSPVAGQPFVRCARCGADNTIHARACDNCSALLDTPEQCAFNEKLWNVQLLHSEKERAELAKMAAAREEQRRNTVRPLPEPGMSPPPELLEGMTADEGPFLFEVLRALQEPRWRMGAAAAMVGLPLLLVTLGGPLLSRLGWGIVVLLVLALLPRRLFRSIFHFFAGPRP